MAHPTTIEPDAIAGVIPPLRDPSLAFVVDPRRTLALIRQAGDQIQWFQAWRDVIQQRASGLFRRVHEDRSLKDATIRELEAHLSRMDRRNADLERALSELASDYERVVTRCMEAEFRAIHAEHRASRAEMAAVRLEDLLVRIGDGSGDAYGE